MTATWEASPEHEAFAGMVNGGILGTLVDCHSNWTAIWALMTQDGLAAAPSSVTADFSVSFRRPTPSGTPLRLVSRAVERSGARVTVETEVFSGDVVTARGRATFVAVGPEHPAFGRW